MKSITIAGRPIGPEYPPFVIAEVGINHEGSLEKALACVDAASEAGADCVKFQTHITRAEMIPNEIQPDNAKEPLQKLIERCELNAEEERQVAAYCDQKGILFLSTPFSREGADRLETLGVPAYKIGSGECNNYPLIRHIAQFGKPVILSTGMNNIDTVRPAVQILREHNCPIALMHCTSMYPTPYNKVHLGGIAELEQAFNVPVGLSDHSFGIYTCLGAVALGASLLEKHFTVSRSWPGPDIPVSIEPAELKEMVVGSRAIFQARGGSKAILDEETPVIRFAYASVVTTRPVRAGEVLGLENVWVKRPAGPILAVDLERVLGKRALRDLPADVQLRPEDIEEFC